MTGSTRGNFGLGLAAGLAIRSLGVAAAIGLVLFFVCAIYTHIRASDYSPQFYLANGFLALNVAVLAVALQANSLNAIVIPLS